MTTTHDHGAASLVPQFARARSFLEGLAAQDFTQLGGALAADARLRALLPAGLGEWTGAEVIAGRFAGWFGGTEDFDLVEATVGEVGGRLHLHWRLRLRGAARRGWFTSNSRPTPIPTRAATTPSSTCSAPATGLQATMPDTLDTWGGWEPAIRDDPFGHFAETRARCPVQRVRLADGHPALVVLGYDAARQALRHPASPRTCSPRSKERRGRGGGPARAGVLPAHAQRRPARPHPAAAAGVPGLRAIRVAALEQAVRDIAGDLLDELDDAGPGATVDLVQGYAHPLPSE